MINADAPIYDFIRLRLLNGEPMSLDSTVMPMNLVPGLTKTTLKVRCFSTFRKPWG